MVFEKQTLICTHCACRIHLYLIRNIGLELTSCWIYKSAQNTES